MTENKPHRHSISWQCPTDIYVCIHIYIQCNLPNWLVVDHDRQFTSGLSTHRSMNQKVNSKDNSERLISKFTLQSNRTIQGSRKPLGPIIQLVRPSHGDRQPRCPVHPFATESGEHTTICFVCGMRLVWNEGWAIFPKLIIKGQSTRANSQQRAWDTHPPPCRDIWRQLIYKLRRCVKESFQTRFHIQVFS